MRRDPLEEGESKDEPDTRPVGGEGEAPIQVRALFEPGRQTNQLSMITENI
jgi:hypothetical protein